MLKRVGFTSFANVDRYGSPDALRLGVASYSPTWKPLSRVEAFTPLRDGKRFRIRDFDGPDAFLDAMYLRCETEGPRALELMHELNNPNVILACWCPGTKTASRQLERFGTFVCHTEAVACWFLNQKLEVYLDDDRTKRMYRRTLS